MPDIQTIRNNQRADNLAYSITLMVFTTIIILFVGPEIPAANREMLFMILGALMAMLKEVTSFEFGSSKGQERNNQAMAEYIKGGNGKTTVESTTITTTSNSPQPQKG